MHKKIIYTIWIACCSLFFIAMQGYANLQGFQKLKMTGAGKFENRQIEITFLPKHSNYTIIEGGSAFLPLSCPNISGTSYNPDKKELRPTVKRVTNVTWASLFSFSIQLTSTPHPPIYPTEYPYFMFDESDHLFGHLSGKRFNFEKSQATIQGQRKMFRLHFTETYSPNSDSPEQFVIILFENTDEQESDAFTPQAILFADPNGRFIHGFQTEAYVDFMANRKKPTPPEKEDDSGNPSGNDSKSKKPDERKPEKPRKQHRPYSQSGWGGGGTTAHAVYILPLTLMLTSKVAAP